MAERNLGEGFPRTVLARGSRPKAFVKTWNDQTFKDLALHLDHPRWKVLCMKWTYIFTGISSFTSTEETEHSVERKFETLL